MDYPEDAKFYPTGENGEMRCLICDLSPSECPRGAHTDRKAGKGRAHGLREGFRVLQTRGLAQMKNKKEISEVEVALRERAWNFVQGLAQQCKGCPLPPGIAGSVQTRSLQTLCGNCKRQKTAEQPNTLSEKMVA